MAIFKYMGVLASEKFLTNRTVRISKPNEYNDPFELKVQFKSQTLLEKREAKLQGVEIFSKEEKLNRYLVGKNEISQYKFEVDDDLIDQICKEVGTTCFTKSNDKVPVSLLMWAHYAESHKGISIEIKQESELVQHSFPIKYVKNRPIVDAKALDEIEFMSLKDLYVKSVHWEYENEIRLAQHLECCSKDGEIYLTDIDEDSIKRVFVGVNANEHIQTFARDFHGKTGIPIVFTKLSNSEFFFEVDEVVSDNPQDIFNIRRQYSRAIRTS